MPGLNRHWLWITLGITAATAAGVYYPQGAILSGAAGAFLFLAGVLLSRWFSVVLPHWAGYPFILRSESVMLLAAGMLAGTLAVFLRLHPPEEDPLFTWARDHPECAGTIQGTISWVLTMPEQPPRNMVLRDVIFQPDHSDQVIRGRYCTVHCRPATFPLYLGQRVEMPVILSGRISAVNQGVYSYEIWCRDRGIHVAAESRVPPKLHPDQAAGIITLLDRARIWHAETLHRCIPFRLWPWVAALWFGDRRLLDQRTVTAFSRTGTAHVLAVSGLHVGLLYLSVASLLGPLRHRRIIRTGLLLSVVMGYAFMAGARGSTIRAAGMVAIFLIYDFFRREPDSITCLSLAGCVQLLAAPWLVRDPGFQMSYTCVAALMIFGDLFSEKLRWMPRPVGGVLAATGSVQLLLIPLVGWHFGLVSLAGITANLIAVPLLTVILWLLLFTAALSTIIPSLATLFAYAAIPPVWLMESAADMFSRIPGAFLYAGRPSLISVCCWFAGAMLLAAAARGIRRRKTALSAGLLFLILAAPLWPLRSHPVGLEVLDTGHADALLLVSPEGETVLVDGGNLQGRRNDGRDIVVPVLSARGITRLDAVIATHADSDHLGGLFSVVNTLPVRKVYVPCPDSFNGKLADQFLAECARLRIPVARIAYPDQIPFSGGTIQVCHPDRNDKQLFDKDNDRSLVLRVSWNSHATALLAGDIEASAEQYLSRRDIRSVLLKAPHHGSNTSSSLPFLRSVAPAGIVISTARENRLPSVGQLARDRLESLGVPVWRTDLDGGLHFSPDSLGFRVSSGREYWRVPLRPVHMTVCANRINAGE